MTGTPQMNVQFAPPGTPAQMNMDVSNPEDFALVGDWAPATLYLVANVVIDATATAPFTMYRAKTQHTSGATFTPDLANWEIVGSTGAGGGLTFKGLWNANTNTPTLASGTGDPGDLFIVSVGGSTNLDGITDWQVNDHAIFNGTTWEKFDNTDAITWEKQIKTDTDYQLVLTDSGTTIVMDNSSAQTVTLISTTGAPEFTVRIIKQGAGDVIIDVENASDVIGDGPAGDGIENIVSGIGSSVTLQLVGLNEWAIISRDPEASWTAEVPPLTITDGFTMGGDTGVGLVDTIQTYPFATATNAVTHGVLTGNRSQTASHGSSTDGFVSGGTVPSIVDLIDKFPFSAATGGVSHGTLTAAKQNKVGSSSRYEFQCVG